MVARSRAELARPRAGRVGLPPCPRTDEPTPDWIRRFTATVARLPRLDDGGARTPRHSSATEAAPGRSGRTTWRTGRGARSSDEPVGVEVVFDAARRADRVVARHRPATSAATSWRSPSTAGRPTAVVPDLPGRLARWGCRSRRARCALGLEVDGAYRVFVAEPDGSTRAIASFARGRGRRRRGARAPAAVSRPTGRSCASGTPSTATSCTPRCGSSTPRTGAAVGDLDDAGHHLDPAAWSPVPGDQRLAFTSERGDFERPAIWDLATRRATRHRRRPAGRRLPGGVVARRVGPARPSRVRGTRHSSTGSTRPRARRTRADRPRRRHRRGRACAPTATSGSGPATRVRPPRILDDGRR